MRARSRGTLARDPAWPLVSVTLLAGACRGR
jgi:hypothetical protein